MALGIKLRPNKPISPHLNGKVERSLNIDVTAFCATMNASAKDIDSFLSKVAHYYNWDRPHSAHGGSPLMERYFELSDYLPSLKKFMSNI